MNAKYILSFLYFLMFYLVIQCIADETITEIKERIANENKAVRQLYMLTLAHFRADIGSKLTLVHVLYVLGECNEKNIKQYLKENNIPANNRSRINQDQFGAIVRKICEINGTKVLDFLERVNISMRYILGDY